MAHPDAKYLSTERVERDGVLVYAEGDEIPVTDVEELRRQGHLGKNEEPPVVEPRLATERIERDGVLIAAEGDVLPDDKEPSEPVKKAAPRKAAAKKRV